jgi:hypothetical protein
MEKFGRRFGGIFFKSFPQKKKSLKRFLFLRVLIKE